MTIEKARYFKVTKANKDTWLEAIANTIYAYEQGDTRYSHPAKCAICLLVSESINLEELSDDLDLKINCMKCINLDCLNMKTFGNVKMRILYWQCVKYYIECLSDDTNIDLDGIQDIAQQIDNKIYKHQHIVYSASITTAVKVILNEIIVV